MDHFARSSLAPRDVFRILFRHRRKFLFCFFGTLAVVVLGLAITPRKYVSEAKLLVKIGRQSVNLDPAATVGSTVSIQESRESEIRSVLDVLESRLMREKVVHRVGAASIIAQELLEPEEDVAGPRFSLLRTLRGMVTWIIPRDDVSQLENAVRILEQSMEIEAGKKSSVVTIRCKSESPYLSQRIVQAYVEQYRNEHVEVNSSESYRFFQKQVETLREELERANNELSETKSALGLTTIEGQREILETQINNLNRDIAESEASLSAALARTEALRRRHPELTTEDLAIGSALTQTAIDQMRDTLYELQIREREMVSKYEPSHPALTAIREQVDQVEAILSLQELRIEAAQIATLKARIAAFERRHADALDKLRLLNRHEVEMAELERRVELLRTNYRTYADKMEQARIAQALDEEQVTNLKLVQPASFVAKAVSPKAGVILFLGLFVATFGSLGTALLCEFFDQSLKTPQQVEAALDLPVLLSIPYVKRQSILLN